MPAMHLAYEHGISEAMKDGVAVLAIRNVGHAGRLGAFTDHATEQGFLTIIFVGETVKNGVRWLHMEEQRPCF